MSAFEVELYLPQKYEADCALAEGASGLPAGAVIKITPRQVPAGRRQKTCVGTYQVTQGGEHKIARVMLDLKTGEMSLERSTYTDQSAAGS